MRGLAPALAGSAAIALIVAAACTGDTARQSAGAGDTTIVVAPDPGPYDSTRVCPADGNWSGCAVTYRLIRAAFDVTRDSGVIREAALAQPGIRLRLARGHIDVFLYVDSLNRKRDAAKLDRKSFLTVQAPSTPGGRTLLESANMLAILEVPNERYRERIANALLAGPPQPGR
jgi:hypothetical protein